jgi:hypothetical protein
VRVTYFYLAILSPSILLFFISVDRDGSGWNALNELAKILGGAALIHLVVLFLDNLSLIQDYWTLLREGQLSKEIRFSYSYLFRIQVKDDNGTSRFLLVRNRKRNYRIFQPPGGVYKVFDSADLNRLGVRDADLLHEKRDIRIQFKGHKLAAVLRYIRNSSNVELDHGREFYEELVDPSILSQQTFPYLNLKDWGQSNTGIRFSDHLGIWEYNLYDIIDVNLTLEQIQAVKSLVDDSRYEEQFVLAPSTIILAKGMNKEQNGDDYAITEHTPRIIKL